MTASTAIALIIVNFILSLFCFYYVTKLANDVADQTVAGVVEGVPLPTKYRLIRFYQMFIGYALGAVTCGLFAALVQLGIANRADDETVTTLAGAGAAIGVIGAASWVLMGGSLLIYLRSLVREATKQRGDA